MLPNNIQTPDLQSNRCDLAPDKLSEAIDTVMASRSRNVEPVLTLYLTIGEALYQLKDGTKGTKDYRKRIEAEAPELLSFDSSTRSDALWLHKALTGVQDADLLSVLGVQTLSELGCSHPSAIRRHYREALTA